MSFLLPFAPPPHAMAQDSDSGCYWSAHSGAKLRGDFSPAARAGARCEYILCLPVLPSSVAKVSSSQRTREEGGRKGRGGSGASRDPRGCQCPVVRVSGSRNLPPTARASPSDAESHLLRQRRGSTLRRLLLVPWQQWLRLRRSPPTPLSGRHAPGGRLPALGVLLAVPGQRRPACQEQGAQRQLHEARPGPRAPARPARLTPAQRRTYQYH
uniref:Uncharacterized protein n=1 Tax=Felis catus TaxID=9685 RepID=A0ABI7YP98_FELCA